MTAVGWILKPPSLFPKVFKAFLKLDFSCHHCFLHLKASRWARCCTGSWCSGPTWGGQNQSLPRSRCSSDESLVGKFFVERRHAYGCQGSQISVGNPLCCGTCRSSNYTLELQTSIFIPMYSTSTSFIPVFSIRQLKIFKLCETLNYSF